MSQALYRKYRPQTFGDLVGQNPIKVTLQNEVESGRVAHAYLFSGPRGVGKTTTARLLAKAVNCTKRKGPEPCGTCSFCTAMAAGKLLDLIEIDAASHTGVDNVRENIIENARFTPQQAAYKIFIIDEVHMLSTSAFNALLKTLEEPPQHVILILATTEIHRVPETIISRCQRFDFKRVSTGDLVKRMQHIVGAEKITISESILQNIARRAEGSVRDAEVLLGQIMAIGGKDITDEEASLVIPRSNIGTILELFSYLVARDAPAALGVVGKLIDEGVNMPDFIRELTEFLRTVLLLKVSGMASELERFELNEDTKQSIRMQLEQVSIKRLVEVIETFVVRTRELAYAPIVQLPLELAILELCNDNGPQHADAGRGGGAAPVPVPAPKAAPKKKTGSPKARSGKKTPAASSASLEKIRSQWPKIVSSLQSANHSISLSLKVGIPVKVENGVLTVGFQHKFHADHLNERPMRSVIEDAVEQVSGLKLTLKITVLEQDEYRELTQPALGGQEGEGDGSQQAWEQALNVFGGEVVEEE
ncbi:MAG: DNA polymerase III subunit gamma/tau [Patescibacteria group bacterium]